MMQVDKAWRNHLLIALGLAAAVLVVDGQVSDFSFTSYDDDKFVDPLMVRKWLSLEGFQWAFTATINGAWMPVTWLSHILDMQLFGEWAGGHHLVNVLFHLANSLLLYLLLFRVTGARWKSGLVAAFFALHPLHVESVAWVAERRDVLATFWWLASIIVYQQWAGELKAWRYLLVFLFFLLALMAKATPVTLPVLLLVWDFWPLQRLAIPPGKISDSLKSLFRLLPEKVPLLVLSGLFSWMTILAVAQEGSLGNTVHYPVSYRLANAVVAYVRYLDLTFWPVDLIPYYPYQIPLPSWQVVGSLVILLGISFVCWRFRQQYPFLLAGWFWYLLTLLPVIGLVQQGNGFAIADRYTYVPLIGIFVMVVWGSDEIRQRLPQLKPLFVGVAAVLLMSLTALCYQQTSYWRDTESLFSYTLSVDPENRFALSQLGVLARSRGQFDVAQGYLERAVHLYPKDVQALVNLAQNYSFQGKDGLALDYYARALQYAPGDANVLVSMGVIRVMHGDLAGAETDFLAALRASPNDPDIRLNLAQLYHGQQRFVEAREVYISLLADFPDFPEAHYGYGLLLEATGERKEALKQFDRALVLNPDFLEARRVIDSVHGREAGKGVGR